MKIKLTADSTVDLSQEIIEKTNTSIMSLNVLLGDKEYLDGNDISNDMIFEYVKTSGVLPKTSARNEEEYTAFFKQYLDQGYSVIHFSLSSTLSASNRCAEIASQNLENVVVIDSKNLSTGIALLLMHAHDLILEGKDFEEIVSSVKSRIPYVQASFVLDNLKYIHKGGRCSSIALLGANLLKLKPTIKVENGKLVVGKKYRGNLIKVLESYVEDILLDNPNYDDKRVFVTYTSVSQEMKDAVIKKVKEKAHFKEILCTTAGSTITSHCGPTTLGILFLNK